MIAPRWMRATAVVTALVTGATLAGCSSNPEAQRQDNIQNIKNHTGGTTVAIINAAHTDHVNLTRPIPTLTLDVIEATLATTTPGALTPPTYERN